MVIFAAALGLALSVITDIEFPRLGFVRVNQFDQQLVHLYEMMEMRQSFLRSSIIPVND